MNFLKRHLTKKKVIVIVAITVVAGGFLLAKQASAADSNDGIASLVLMLTSWLMTDIVYVLGQLLLIFISILIKVCSFNEFVDANIVTIGWVIMRDLANLVIVIAMLFIAFGTTLNKKSYAYQTMLPKLVVAAVLVNFSKEITGALISLSQYVMLFFVHAFENIAAGNITYGLGIDDMLSIRKAARTAGASAEINDWNVLGALVMATIMLAVALGVIVAMVLMLLYRIVELWLLIIFSPVYFAGNLLPTLGQYASQWKTKLTNNLVKGPSLAFMFWLSMTVLSQITTENRLIKLQMESAKYFNGGTLNTTDYAFFASQISSPQKVFEYLVTIVLFIFTVGVAKTAGGTAAAFLGGYMGRLNKVGKWFTSRPGALRKAAWRGTKSMVKNSTPILMAGAAGERFLGTKVGKKIVYMGSKARAERAEARKVRVQERWGGVPGQRAAARYYNSKTYETMHKMDEGGELSDDQTIMEASLADAISKKDEKKARAVLLHMAKSEYIDLRKATHFNDYVTAFKPGPVVEKSFENLLKNAQNSSVKRAAHLGGGSSTMWV